MRAGFALWHRALMGPVSALYRQYAAEGRLVPDPAQERVLPRLDAVVAALAAGGAGSEGRAGQGGGGWRSWLGLGGGATTPGATGATKGLYLWGGVGRGKSMLMDLTVAAADLPGKRRVHFHAFMQEIHAGLDAARRTGTQDAVRPVAMEVARQVRLLCFDEMQITDIADAMIVGRLFQILFEQGVVVITTSNRAPEELYKHGLNRALFLPFIDLIRAHMEVVELVSDHDWRQGRIGGGQVWFTPADATARAALDEIWADLTGHSDPAPRVLTVRGRAVELPAYADGVARAGFWDLCGKPLGPADYLAIAADLEVLILEGIPVLGLSNYNEAKRFVTLIDTLYEAKVRLIASAADEPERLYLEGEGSFEFERTASRLREMQDAGWGRS